MKLNILEENFLKLLPKSPGVYRFYDIDNNLLYVGKAINLSNRVKSYFRKQNDTSPRISLMVRKIYFIEITITENEVSALILENNLIKNLKPKYNIIFRDDKTYPLIRLSQHKFAKIDYYRGKINSAYSYFGPYPNAASVRETIDTVQKIFKLRTCTDSFFANRARPCILFQIKRCTAPCVGKVNELDYALQVSLATDYLQGNFADIVDKLTKKMYVASDSLDFELAAGFRDKIGLIREMQASQIITKHDMPLKADLLIHEVIANKLYVYIIIIRNGMYIGDTHFILDVVDDNWMHSLEVFLESYYLSGRNTESVIVEASFNKEFKTFLQKALNIKLESQMTGNVQKLFAMGRVNLQKIIESGSNYLVEGASVLAQLVGISKINRIECIDVSHNHGDDAVAGVVVYENGVIDNSKYRKYNLSKEVNGNDILAMELVLKRRLSNQDLLLPDVFLVDGGRLQFEIVKNIVSEYDLCGKIKVVAIFKGEHRNPKFDRLILENGKIVSYSEEPIVFKLLQGLRDEAHRFAITGHRKKQAKKMSSSAVEDIPNVGLAKRKALIAHFGSVKNIANANVEDLQKVTGIGALLANQIYLYFH